jgi:hypothetical protein
MREIKSFEGGTTRFELVPMPEPVIRARLEAEAPIHTACYGLTWIDNVDVTGLLDTIEDLRRDNEALKAELTRARGLLDRHGRAELDRGATGDDTTQEICEGGC